MREIISRKMFSYDEAEKDEGKIVVARVLSVEISLQEEATTYLSFGYHGMYFEAYRMEQAPLSCKKEDLLSAKWKLD